MNITEHKSTSYMLFTWLRPFNKQLRNDTRDARPRLNLDLKRLRSVCARESTQCPRGLKIRFDRHERQKQTLRILIANVNGPFDYSCLTKIWRLWAFRENCGPFRKLTTLIKSPQRNRIVDSCLYGSHETRIKLTRRIYSFHYCNEMLVCVLIYCLPPPQSFSLRVHNGTSAANDTRIAIDFLSKLNIRFYAFNKIAPRKIQLPLQACGKLIKRAWIIMQAMAVLSQRKGYSEGFWNVMKAPGIFTWSPRVFESQIILIRALVITKQITEGWRENFFKGCKGVLIDHFKERILDLYS